MCQRCTDIAPTDEIQIDCTLIKVQNILYCVPVHRLRRPKRAILHVTREATAQGVAGYDANRAHQAQCEGSVAVVPCANW